MGLKDQLVLVDKRGFPIPISPIRASGLLRFARSTENLLNDYWSGERAWSRTYVADMTEVTIASNAITPAQAAHSVKASSGTSDTLKTITAVNQTYLLLKAKTGHTITIQHGTGNVYTSSGQDVLISGNIAVLLWCDQNVWSLIAASGEKVNLTSLTDPAGDADGAHNYAVGSFWLNTLRNRLWVCVDNTTNAAVWKRLFKWSNYWRIRAAAGTLQPVGIAAPASGDFTAPGLGLPTNTYAVTFITSGAGSTKGFQTASADLVTVESGPIYECQMRTDSNITNLRFWFGLTTNISSAPPNSDTFGSNFIGFRFSTGASDGGWKPILSNGSSQTVGTAIGTVAVSTEYKLRFRVDGTTVYFSVNNSPEQALSTNLPSGSLGAVGEITQIAAGAQNDFYFSWMEVGW